MAVCHCKAEAGECVREYLSPQLPAQHIADDEDRPAWYGARSSWRAGRRSWNRLPALRGLPGPTCCKIAHWLSSCKAVQTETAHVDKTTSSVQTRHFEGLAFLVEQVILNAKAGLFVTQKPSTPNGEAHIAKEQGCCFERRVW